MNTLGSHFATPTHMFGKKSPFVNKDYCSCPSPRIGVLNVGDIFNYKCCYNNLCGKPRVVDNGSDLQKKFDVANEIYTNGGKLHIEKRKANHVQYVGDVTVALPSEIDSPGLCYIVLIDNKLHAVRKRPRDAKCFYIANVAREPRWILPITHYDGVQVIGRQTVPAAQHGWFDAFVLPLCDPAVARNSDAVYDMLHNGKLLLCAGREDGWYVLCNAEEARVQELVPLEIGKDFSISSMRVFEEAHKNMLVAGGVSPDQTSSFPFFPPTTAPDVARASVRLEILCMQWKWQMVRVGDSAPDTNAERALQAALADMEAAAQAAEAAAERKYKAMCAQATVELDAKIEAFKIAQEAAARGVAETVATQKEELARISAEITTARATLACLIADAKRMDDEKTARRAAKAEERARAVELEAKRQEPRREVARCVAESTAANDSEVQFSPPADYTVMSKLLAVALDELLEAVHTVDQFEEHNAKQKTADATTDASLKATQFLEHLQAVIVHPAVEARYGVLKAFHDVGMANYALCKAQSAYQNDPNNEKTTKKFHEACEKMRRVAKVAIHACIDNPSALFGQAKGFLDVGYEFDCEPYFCGASPPPILSSLSSSSSLSIDEIVDDDDATASCSSQLGSEERAPVVAEPPSSGDILDSTVRQTRAIAADDRKKHHSYSQLLAAACEDDVASVDLLLTNGIDPSTNESQVLRRAVLSGSYHVFFRLLSDKRVDPSAMDNKALRQAARLGHDAIVLRLLRDRRVDATACDNEALVLSARFGHAAVVAHLMQAQVDPSARNNEALRMASYNGHIVVVKQLLQDSRAFPAVHLALSYAESRSQHAVVNWLRTFAPPLPPPAASVDS